MKKPLITIKLLDHTVLLRSPAMPEMFVECKRADDLLDRLSRALKVVVEEYEARGQEIVLPIDDSIDGHAFIEIESGEGTGYFVATSSFLPELVAQGAGLHELILKVSDALEILLSHYKLEGKSVTGVK
jgi:predicted RNase H-like HicB family nuclease